MALTKNVGPMDKNYRLAAAGLIVLGTAIFRVCPAYYPLKINTNKDGGN